MARAVREPSDYRAGLFRTAAAQVSALTTDGRPDEAITWGMRFQRAVEPAAPVAYEVALAYRLTGHNDDALANYDRALALDPSMVAALYDRGEVYLIQRRMDEARRDFEGAVALKADQWPGHFRLAEFAARDRDPAQFERHLTQALTNGFDFRSVLADPAWHAWATDADLGPVVAKLIVVYSDEKLLDALRQPL